MSMPVRFLIASPTICPVELPWPYSKLARIGLGVGDELRHGADWQARIDRNEGGKTPDPRHRIEVLDRIVGHVLEEAGRRRMGGVGGDKKRVAVGLRPCHRARRDDAAAADLVLDHEGLPEHGLKLTAQQPRRRIGHAAGRERHHDRDLAGRIFGEGRRGQRGDGNESQRQPSKQRVSSMLDGRAWPYPRISQKTRRALHLSGPANVAPRHPGTLVRSRRRCPCRAIHPGVRGSLPRSPRVVLSGATAAMRSLRDEEDLPRCRHSR
jgi:hypothetical protein